MCHKCTRKCFQRTCCRHFKCDTDEGKKKNWIKEPTTKRKRNKKNGEKKLPENNIHHLCKSHNPQCERCGKNEHSCNVNCGMNAFCQIIMCLVPGARCPVPCTFLLTLYSEWLAVWDKGRDWIYVDEKLYKIALNKYTIKWMVISISHANRSLYWYALLWHLLKGNSIRCDCWLLVFILLLLLVCCFFHKLLLFHYSFSALGWNLRLFAIPFFQKAKNEVKWNGFPWP